MACSFSFFSWRQAILQSDLAPTTRHVLLTLACHMNDAGESCYPSVELLAKETGLSTRAVITHLNLAKESGWIEVDKHGFRGQKWNRNDYKMAWPESLFEEQKTEKAVNDVHGLSDKAVNDVHVKAVNDVHHYRELSIFNSSVVSTNVDTGQQPAKRKPLKVTISEDGTYKVPPELLDQWKQAYPHVDLRAEVKKARSWLSANPSRRKKNLTAFLVNWFARTEADTVSRNPNVQPIAQEREHICQSVHPVTGKRCGCHAVMYRQGRGLCSHHAMDEAFGWDEMDRQAKEAA